MSSRKLSICIFLIYAHLNLATHTPNKFEFLLSQVYDPYQYHLESANNLKNEIIGTFQSLFFPKISTILNEAFDQSDVTSSYYSSNTKTNTQPQQNPLSSKPLKQDEDVALRGSASQTSQTSKHHAERMLFLGSAFEGYCLNSGYPVQAYVDLYYCNDHLVTPEEYSQRYGVGCSIRRTETTVCYCPFDFYGDLCENYNQVHCDAENLSHPPGKCTPYAQECIYFMPSGECMEGTQGIPSKNSKYYSYSLEGEKPCYAVKRDSILNMDFRMNCRYDRPEFAFEGIKPNDEYEYEIVEGQDTSQTFPYSVDEPNLKITFFYPFVVNLRFLNWMRITSPYQIDVVVDGKYLTGAVNISFSLEVTPEMVENYSVGGRFYYELVEQWGVWIPKRVAGVLEDADFVEPKKVYFNDRYRIWRYVGICAAVLLVAAAMWICKYIVRNKESVMGKMTLQSVYFQLADEHEISVGGTSTDIHSLD